MVHIKTKEGASLWIALLATAIVAVGMVIQHIEWWITLCTSVGVFVVVALAALFIIFCYQVFMRYVLRQPQAWAGEVEQSCFLWLVLLGACYAQRMKAHVTFTLLYDKLSIKGKAVVAMLGDIIIAFTAFCNILPSLH
mgnify:FL=1